MNLRKNGPSEKRTVTGQIMVTIQITEEVLCKSCASCKTLVLKKRMRETEKQSVVKTNTPLQIIKKRLENSAKLLRMEKNAAVRQLD